MKKLVYPIVLILIVFFAAPALQAQVLVSDNPAATADPASMLDVQSTSKGFLFPRMTQLQRNAITNPPTSMVIFQTDNTPGVYYNAGTPASPNWLRMKESSQIGGYWSPDGSNIYFDTGNVGIGENSPSSQLHVNGASMFENDSVYITGRPGRIYLNGESGYEPAIRFSHNGTSMFKLHLDAPGSSPYLSVTGLVEDPWGVSQTGRVWHSYPGTVQAHVLISGASTSTLYIDAQGTATGSRGINAAVSDPSANDETLAIGGWNLGEGEGVYGENDAYGNFGYLGTNIHGAYGEYRTATVGNRGALGSEFSGAWGEAGITGHVGRLGLDGTGTDWGVYGQDGAASDPNFGGIGTSNYGVYGEYNSENFWGVLGADNAAVYGSLGGGTQNLDDGDFAVIGHGVWNNGESGSGYYGTQAIGGVMGLNNAGVQYGFGVAGYTRADGGNRTGGVLGYIRSNDWGALGYRSNSGTYYGSYVNGGSGTGTGKSSNEPMKDIGLGASGDLFGAHVNGAVYGLYAKGENYGIYADGDMYRTGADVHLQMDNTGQNNVMYTLVSPEMTVQTYGIGQLQNGKASVEFDDAFANIVSSSEPIIVTITPIGKSKGVYLDRVDANGFMVEENESGKSSIQFTWIAIGKRAGYENKSLPADVIASDYNNKIERGLSRDADPNAQGEGLYYQNGTLHTGQAPAARSSNAIEVQQAKKLEYFDAGDKASQRKSSKEREAAPKGKYADDKIK